MSPFDPVITAPLGLVMVVVGVAVTVAILRISRIRRRARRRVVERPNSYYTSQLVREHETRHRWRDIALDRMHEINREEVVRLLARVEAVGIDALRPNERVFLDHMARLAGTRTPTEPPGPGEPAPPAGPVAPEPRHHPA